jgi:hypothetical protein
MSERIFCPACKCGLRLPVDCVDPWLSCSRCLARIRNPQSIEEGETPSPTDVIEEHSPEDLRCPGCGVHVEPQWLFCPHCEERLYEQLPNRWSRSVEGNVRRNNFAWQVIRTVLAVFGGYGILIALMSSVATWVNNDVRPLMVTLAVLLVLAAISALSGSNQGKQSFLHSVARITLTTLTLAGALMAGGCLFMGAIFFFVCYPGKGL